MTMRQLEKIRNLALKLAIICYFLGAFSAEAPKAAFSFFFAAMLFAGSGYFANNLIHYAKKRRWKRKRQARLAKEAMQAS